MEGGGGVGIGGRGGGGCLTNLQPILLEVARIF